MLIAWFGSVCLTAAGFMSAFTLMYKKLKQDIPSLDKKGARQWQQL